MKKITFILSAFAVAVCSCTGVSATWQDEQPFPYDVWKADKAYSVLEVTSGKDCEVKAKVKIQTPLKASAVFVETVIGDEFDTTRFAQWGSRTIGQYGEVPCEDMLGDCKTSLSAGVTKKLWVGVTIPENTPAGRYSGSVKISGIRYPFEISVCEETLPQPEDYKFDLDLWQNPYAVARYHNVPLWSEEHFEHMRPVMEQLRDAGQKYITATILNRPWDGQTEDPFGSMVVKTRNEDGSWSYDYTVFDKYVQWMMDLGIDKGINCYSMIPWKLEFDYHDAVSGRDTTMVAKPGSREYSDYWGSFITDFGCHLRNKGWFDITRIAMDERSEEDMKAAFSVIRGAEPEMKVSLAGRYHESIEKELDYLSVTMLREHPMDILQRRREEGKKTTFYVCCAEKYPNTFLISKPDEAAWLPLYAFSKGYDGFLRWSFNSWTADPCKDGRFRTWPAGDCYIVYPEGHSSVRFEKLAEGIRLCEKLGILSARWTVEASSGSEEAAAKLAGLRTILDGFTFEQITAEEASPAVNAIRRFIQNAGAAVDPAARVCAFVWPSCHDDSVAHEKIWPEGIGEWEIINKATPHFKGHQQPKHPLWGCLMDDDPETAEKWIQTALAYGVNTFVYDWYWYDGKPFLEGALDDGFLKAPSCEKMDFYLMWANHDAKADYWSCYRNAGDKSILFAGKVTEDQYHDVVERVIKLYFHKPNYAKIDGKPIFMIYDVDKFIQSFDGDLDKAAEALKWFRGECVKAGFKGLYLQCSVWSDAIFKDPKYAAGLAERIGRLGFDGLAGYNMAGKDLDYAVFAEKAAQSWSKWADILGKVDLFPSVSIGWDDTPRFPEKGQEDVVRFNRTPEVFQKVLGKAKVYSAIHFNGDKNIVYINAWNEWVEDSYLLPDVEHGYGYLEAVKNVFGPCKR